ncbi:MAG: enoyl-CoA hydratase, partial [Sphingomonas bacterium]|nr:enoyl-CoA hydratase [Sphingomonas bacterium]
FSSGGDVHEIIGPLTAMAMPELLAFTRMTGDLVKAMRGCPQPIVAALDGICVGAGATLPRVSGHGRAADLLFSGRAMSADEGLAWGFYSRVVDAEMLDHEAQQLGRTIAHGPAFAHAMTKRQLDIEWAVSIDTAIEMEAQAQAICMATNDFGRAYDAFANKRTPIFKGD